MTRLLKLLAGVVLVPVFAVILAMLLFWMPCEFVVSTCRLIAATSVVKGQLLDVHVVRGGHGTSGIRVKYQYVVNGRQYTGERVGPEWLHATFSGGGSLSGKYSTGAAVEVHFNPRNPAFSFLEYGWPKWSIGLPLVVWGMAFFGFVNRARVQHRSALWLRTAAAGIPGTGFAVLFFFPPYIAVSQSCHLVLTCCGLFLLCAVYLRLTQKRRPGPGPGSAVETREKGASP